MKHLYDSLVSKIKNPAPLNFTEVDAGPGSFVIFCERMTLRFAGMIRTFSPRERLIFFTLLLIFLGSAFGLLWKLNHVFMIEVPARGGSFTEGVIGAPRFINPVLAISDADRDMTALVYSGLMRANSDGSLTPDLAESYTISDDGLLYAFVLKDGLKWHDGTDLTPDDIIFTVQKVQDSVLKSPRRASWEGVSVQKMDERTVVFTLKQPYAPFLENTTLGIIPKHIWDTLSSEQFSFSTWNTEPVGSGPYKVRNIKKDGTGIPSYYDLAPFRGFALGKPYIASIRVRFYANENELLRALYNGEVETVNAISPEKASLLEKGGSRVMHFTLPRVFGVFFNQNQNAIFAKKNVRLALNAAIDRELLIQNVLYGYGTPLKGPLPPGSQGFGAREDDDTGATSTAPLSAAALLDKEGFVVNPETGRREKKTKTATETISFSISTSDAPELKAVGEAVKNAWEALGISVDLKVFNAGDLNQNVIRPRKYDSLLFGEIVGRESDPFAFWHSSQRNDPGLNIALYANLATDKILEEGRVLLDPDARTAKYRQFEKILEDDVPAVFLYSPDFIYVTPEKLNGIETGTISVSSERFLSIHRWYIETDYVWKIFAPFIKTN